jgi:hypothetical protein
LAFDLDRRKARRQRRARHDVLRAEAEALLEGIEIDRVAPQQVRRADAEPDGAAVQEIEIDELCERLAQGSRVVKAQRRLGTPRLQPNRR